MRKFLSLFLLLLLSTANVVAAPRTLNEMMAAARKAIDKPALAHRSRPTQQLEVLSSTRMLSVIGYADGGFAVIAADDRFAPVVGYSETTYSSDNMPPALQWWLDATERAMDEAVSTGTELRPAASYKSSAYAESVPELLTCRWDQETPYNNMLVSITGLNYPTGCMATAMAQIMYYYGYPVNGQGYKGYAINGHNGNYDFESTTYRYDNMLDVYAPGGYTQAEADAVATLMLHCGVAVDMNYGLNGSGSFSNNATLALNRYFKFSTRLYSRDVYSRQDWMNLIFDELSNGRPILYGGVTTQNSGHAFVFDGYDADGLVHVNWGWSGSGNGYFDVALLNSNQGSFTESQDMIFIRTADAPSIPYSSQWGILPSMMWMSGSGQVFATYGRVDMSVTGRNLMFECSNLTNCDAENFSGTLGLLARSVDDGSISVLLTQSVNNFAYHAVWPSNASDYTGTVSVSGLDNGTYEVFFATKADAETDWQPVLHNESIDGTYLLSVTNDGVQITTGIDDVVVDGSVVGGMPADGNIYSIDGRRVGDDAERLERGLYIRGGRKYVVR